MWTWRERLVSAFVIVFIGSHACVTLVSTQHWPVLSYTMYAFDLSNGLSCPVTFGVPEDDAKPEFPIRSRDIGMSAMEMSFAFRKILKFPYRNPTFDTLAASCPPAEDRNACATRQLAAGALSFLIGRYDQIRHDDATMPALKGMRVYEVEYVGSSGNGFEMRAKHLRAEWLRPGAASPK